MITRLTLQNLILSQKINQQEHVLGGVKITAASAKGTMEQFSNPDGVADFIRFTPTWWTLTYECPGYEKLVMPDQKAERGLKTKLVAELVKI
jgi:hypothetical protein